MTISPGMAFSIAPRRFLQRLHAALGARPARSDRPEFYVRTPARGLPKIGLDLGGRLVITLEADDYLGEVRHLNLCFLNKFPRGTP